MLLSIVSVISKALKKRSRNSNRREFIEETLVPYFIKRFANVTKYSSNFFFFLHLALGKAYYIELLGGLPLDHQA